VTSEITLISSVRINCYTTSSAKFVLSSRNRRSPPAGFSYIQKDALHDDLIVAWRVTGGSEEVRKEGRGAKGAPGVCHKGEMNAWALNVNGRSAREKKEGKVRNFGRCPYLGTHSTRAFFPVLTRSQIIRSRDIVLLSLKFSDVHPCPIVILRPYYTMHWERCELWKTLSIRLYKLYRLQIYYWQTNK